MTNFDKETKYENFESLARRLKKYENLVNFGKETEKV